MINIALFSIWYFSIALCNFIFNASIYMSLKKIEVKLKSKSPTFRKSSVTFGSYDSHRTNALLSIFWPYVFIKSLYILIFKK